MSSTEAIRIETREQFMKMIRNSWTWARLTEEEAKRCEKVISKFPLIAFREKRHIWDALHEVYGAFLEGTGYKAIGWREPATEEEAPF